MQHLPAVQNVMAATFGIPATQVRVVSPHSGGGFGVKGFVWPHELLAACSFINVLMESKVDSPVHQAAVAHLAKIRGILCSFAKEANLQEPETFPQV